VSLGIFFGTVISYVLHKKTDVRDGISVGIGATSLVIAIAHLFF